ncbi:uncharacterized protein EV422DRAFT_431828 [Fimicolochytrium jonesii]|uniref:uncharacterized protein n=1 Tax=Fimicolochytrium jonesii TaxID=1396493 RepID=UPI0022FDF541|nr:uncharacterized protein EV422DRAFT_431828 [Fimicolochytrium jonesii]KAI8821793.1 hypothetical protein EV422DRAFT_431828 [Fimicolochytrium jonesii]
MIRSVDSCCYYVGYRSTPDSGDGHGDGASEATGSEDSHNTAKANLSRHVTSVISHFTATEEGYRRLLNELDDFLHVVTPSGTIVYCSPSVKRFLGYTGNDLAGHHVSEILHREDRAPLLRTLQSQDLSGGDGTSASSATGISVPPSCTMYLRYQKKAGDFVLLEVRGKQLMDDKHIKSLTNGPGAANAASSVGTARCVVLTAREYRSKASLAVDSLLEYRIENLRLRRQLSVELRERGIDPGTHPLLRVGPPSPRIPHPHDPESFEPFNDLETGRPVGDQQAGSLSDNAGMKDKASYRGDKDQSLSSSSLVAVSDINIGVKEKSEPSAPPKRKRKAPRSEELFCRQCGTTSSPEWRKGPDGPKTLCNACGLAYSKKQRKFNIADTGGGPAAGTNGAGGGSSVAAGRASGDSAITNHSSKAGPKLGSATSTALIPDTPVPQGKNA